MINNRLETNFIANFDQQLKFFLAESNIVDAKGNVYSWINPRNPGFVYPEIMGLYLNLSSQLTCSEFEFRPFPPELTVSKVGSTISIPSRLQVDRQSFDTDTQLELRSHRIAQQLQKLVPQSGGLGKQGKIYVFDNCMAISGLLAYKKYLAGHVDSKILSRMADFVVRLLQRRQVCIDDCETELKLKPHWSKTFGASMLKNVIALWDLTEETGDSAYSQLASEIAEEVINSCFRRSFFRAFPTTETVYCHAHCYALEGLLYLQSKGDRRYDTVLEAGVEQLRVWQNQDGSLYNWYHDDSKPRFKVADATSQAIRLWLAISRERYAENIQRGWQFLTSLQSPQTGLHYHPDSQDRNSWASIFALQATNWSLNNVYGDLLV